MEFNRYFRGNSALYLNISLYFTKTIFVHFVRGAGMSCQPFGGFNRSSCREIFRKLQSRSPIMDVRRKRGESNARNAVPRRL
jgi:hypothetical protein